MDKEIVLNLRLNIDPAIEEQLVFLVQAVVDTVTPEGGYEQGDGSQDGSQLVDLEWWSPEHGCDSLEHTLDAIRARLIAAVTNWYQAALSASSAPAEGEAEELVELVEW